MACNTAKKFLSRRGVQFEEKDVQTDEAALTEMAEKAAGVLATPTIIIGETVIVGHDPKGLDEALKKAGMG